MESQEYIIIGNTSNTQITSRLPENLFMIAETYAEKYGFTSIQELIREILREKLLGSFGEEIQ